MKKDLVDKLVEMYMRGTRCEKEVAYKKIQEYCDANGYNLDRILNSKDETKWRKIEASVTDTNVRTLVLQIAMMVLDKSPLESSSPTDDELWVECTEKQLIEINVAISVLISLFLKDVKNLMVAFVIQNSLYPSKHETPPSHAQTETDTSDIDMRAVLKLMDGASKGQIRKQIKG